MWRRAGSATGTAAIRRRVYACCGFSKIARRGPIAGEGGRLSGLRFVFPPYQVGPYSDGTQTVDVPASLLAPHVAPAYAGLFAKG